MIDRRSYEEVNLVIYNQFKERDRNDRYPEIQVVTSRW